jgi:serine/threonine protein kinase
MEQVSFGKIGRYDVIRVLGRGGMGEVLLAQDENLDRRVAIKRPLKSAMAEGLARFQIEAKAATLRHPNIPAVYEMGVHDDLPFIAMEYVEGESLEKIIAAKREMDLITKLSIIEQVCSALGYAHSKGVIHRDIKPANIIVQPDGVARIIDFGIAKVQDDNPGSDLTKASQLIGSLHYIAPERFWGGAIDGRVDIFSVGVTLFKLLTGTEPFVGGEATASFKIMNEAHSPLGAYLHDYPPALDEIIEKSLAKNPEDRYRTGEDFADALHEVMEDLKRSRVTELFNDAERLATERRFAPALELLDEAIRLDPSNTQARKLRKFVREHQERIRRAERLRESLLRSDDALLSGNFDEALTQLRDALSLDPESAEIKAKVQTVEAKKRRHERSTKALGEAEIAKSRGDINGAMRIVTRALEEDKENKKLQATCATLARQLELEVQRGRLLELLEQASRALAARDLDNAEALLNEAGTIDAANLETDKLRRELVKTRELESRRSALVEIEARVQELIRSEMFDKAVDLLSRALEKLPNETTLHRLKAEVDAEARRFQARRLVESAIRRAQEQFTASPLEALTTLQRAIEQAPGEERLIAYERTLRRELEAQRSEQVRENTVLKARELMSCGEFERATEILDSFQVEFGEDADITALLSLTRSEVAERRRKDAVEKALSDARAHMREGRLDEAVALLESGVKQTGEATINHLLHEAREQQAALVRKFEALQKRVELLRNRGEVDEAIRVLEEEPASGLVNTGLHKLLKDLNAEREQKQAIANAIAVARDAAKLHDFVASLDGLHTVAGAYGESPEITQAVAEIEGQRSTHAQEVVTGSVEEARACLLKKNPKGALEALKACASLLEYAGEQKQAEWQKLGLGVKKALEQTGATGASGAFDQQLASIAQAHPRRVPIWAIASVAGVMLVGAVAIVLIPRRPAPQNIVHTQIVLPKVPAGATVRIDGIAQTVNPSGAVVADVKPGPHEVSVAKDGFEAFNDRLDVDSGQSVREEEVKLSPLPPVGVPTGTFAVIPQAEVPAVKVFVNGELKGEKRAGEKIILSVGSYHVRYAWTGYLDSKDRVIEIAKDDNFEDKVLLVKAPTTAKSGPALATAVPAQPTQPTPAASTPVAAPKGSLEANASSIERGQSVTLVWKLDNVSSGEITDLGKVDAVGFRSVSPSQTTTYQLIANGAQLAVVRVEVREPIKVTAPPQPTQPAASSPIQPSGPDKSVLQQAVMATYASVFSRASGKSSKDCKAAFTGAYSGKLKDFTTWCDFAKSFTPAEQCSQVGGSPDAPSLSCVERVDVRLKDGGTQNFPSQSKIFHFSKAADGSWNVTGW